MKKNIFTMAIIAMFAFCSMYSISCTEENLIGDTSNYTIAIQTESILGQHFLTENKKANVIISKGDYKLVATTDTTMQAHFWNIETGTYHATVSFPDNTIISWDFYVDKGTQNVVKLKWLPIEAPYCATLSGRLYVGNKQANQEVGITLVNNDSLSFIDGNVYNAYCNTLTFCQCKTINGEYSIALPATTRGMHYILNADDFYDNDKTWTTTTDTVTLYSSKNTIYNIIYK